jgi:hypothetical protein
MSAKEKEYLKVYENVLSAKNLAETYLEYAIANKQKELAKYWTTQLSIFNDLLNNNKYKKLQK